MTESGQAREPQETAAPGHPHQPGPVAGEDVHVDPSMDPDVQATSDHPTGQTVGESAGETVGDDGDPRVAELEASLAERTADLQRLQADYVNYKRRVDRDREVVREGATASVLTALLPVLDDIDRAREHGELEGGFKAVADSLERTVSGLGLQRFGDVGDGFDPRVHEALMHSHAADVDGPVCSAILQAGYRIGERVVRPARVAVAEPDEPEPAEAPEPAESAGSPDPTAYDGH